MSRKWVKIIAILIFILSGSYFVYNKLTKPNLGPKLLKKGQHSQMPMCVRRSMTSMEIKLLWEIK